MAMNKEEKDQLTDLIDFAEDMADRLADTIPNEGRVENEDGETVQLQPKPESIATKGTFIS